jgi:hypothetical protein
MAVITAALSVLLCAAMVAACLGLLRAGLRAGDRPGDVVLTAVRPCPSGAAVRISAHNPGRQAVIVGASLRRRSLRLRAEGRSYVSVPRDTAGESLLAGRYAVVCALAAGESRTLDVPAADPGLAHAAELTVAIGEPDRLRVIHRAVELGVAQSAEDRRLTGRRRLATLHRASPAGPASPTTSAGGAI